MSGALALIRLLKQISTLCLFLTVAYGTYAFDRRFTMLLIPPYLLYLGQSGFDFSELPVIKLILRPFQQNGTWTNRIFLMAGGVACAGLMDRLLSNLN